MTTYADELTRRTCNAVATGAAVATIATTGAMLVIEGHAEGRSGIVATGSQSARTTQAATLPGALDGN